MVTLLINEMIMVKGAIRLWFKQGGAGRGSFIIWIRLGLHCDIILSYN
jgi:hypothetical protein